MANNQDPLEIIGAPYQVYVARVGTPFPDVDETPGLDWQLLGSFERLGEDGVTVALEQEINDVYGQLTIPIKAFRTQEGMLISFPLMDMRMEALRYLLNGNPITTNPASNGTPGRKGMGMYRGPNVEYFAWLIRGYSPEAAENYLNCQYEVYKGANTGNTDFTYTKGEPTQGNFEVRVYANPAATSDANRLAYMRYATAPAS
jgi:hypothetical protein